MTVDAQNGAVFVATTRTWERPTNRSTGVLRSTDFGMSWNPVNTGIYDRWIFSTKADPRHSGRVFYGTLAAVYRSDNGGLSWSEKNVGLSRVPCISVSVSGTNFLTAVYNDYGFPFGSPTNFYQLLSRFSVPPDPFGSICLTTNSGSTWQIVQEEAWEFAGSEALISPTGTFFVLGKGSWQIFANRPQLYRSDNRGQTWVPYYWMPNAVLHHLRGLSVAIDPQLPRVVYAGTNSQPQAPNYPLLMKSTNDGISWTELTGAVPVPNSKIYCIAVDATSSLPGHESKVIYAAGSNMGVRKSTDAGQTWMPSGLEPYTIRGLALNPTNGNILFAATASEGIFRSVDAGLRWQQVYNEGGFLSIRIHPQVTSTIYALQRTDHNAQSWLILRNNQNGDPGSWQPYGYPLSVPPHKLDIDPTNPNRIYCATDKGVYSIPHIWTGELAANTTWRSGETYLVEGRLTVRRGVTLTIEPGATVSFFDSAALIINGALQAVGTPAGAIQFRSHTGNRWYGIVIRNPAQSNLRYCTISDAQYGVGYISSSVGQQPLLAHSRITDCTIGIYLYGPYQYSYQRGITDNTITGAEFGMVLWGNEYSWGPRIENNRIENGLNTGMWVARSRPVLYNNRIYRAGHTGVRCTDYAAPEFGINRRHTRPGYNTVAKHGFTQLRAESFSNPFLGLVDDEDRCNLIAGGLNRLYHDRDDVIRVLARGKGTVVQADRNFWGYPVQSRWFVAERGAEIIRRCPLEQEESPETALLLQAAAHRAHGRFEEAIVLYKTLIETYPNSPEAAAAMSALGDVYADLEKLTQDTTVVQEKIEYLEENAQTHPDEMVKMAARIQLAREYELKEAWDEARTLYMGILQDAQSADIKAIVYRALVNLHARYLDDLDGARQWLDEMASSISDADHVSITRLDLALFTGETFTAPMHKGASSAYAGGSRDESETPTRYSLEQNFPNPFNPTTEIWFKLGADGYITLKLYDALGREVKTLAEGEYESGYHSMTVDASELTSGVYFYRLTTPHYTSVKKMLMLK